MISKSKKLHETIEKRFGSLKKKPSFQVILPQESIFPFEDDIHFDILFSVYPIEEYDQLITNNEKYITLHIVLNANKLATRQDIYDAIMAYTNLNTWELIEYIIGLDYFVTENKLMSPMDYYDSFFELEDLPDEMENLVTIFHSEYIPVMIDFIEQEVKKINIDAYDPLKEDLLLSNYNYVDVLSYKY